MADNAAGVGTQVRPNGHTSQLLSRIWHITGICVTKQIIQDLNESMLAAKRKP